MKYSVTGWKIAGFLFTSVVGTLLHFLYDWSGENVVAGLFLEVNESIWEHIKLVYFPMCAFALIQRRYLQDSRFWCIKLVGMLTALILIPAMYYTYSGALGISVDWFNITIFFLAAGAACCLETRLLKGAVFCNRPSGIAIGLYYLIGFLFVFLTFLPLPVPLFANPRTGGYGIQ